MTNIKLYIIGLPKTKCKGCRDLFTSSIGTCRPLDKSVGELECPHSYDEISTEQLLCAKDKQQSHALARLLSIEQCLWTITSDFRVTICEFYFKMGRQAFGYTALWSYNYSCIWVNSARHSSSWSMRQKMCFWLCVIWFCFTPTILVCLFGFETQGRSVVNVASVNYSFALSNSGVFCR